MWPLFKKIQMITTLYFPFDSSEKSEPLKELEISPWPLILKCTVWFIFHLAMEDLLVHLISSFCS